jgi:hypothetical protein
MFGRKSFFGVAAEARQGNAIQEKNPNGIRPKHHCEIGKVSQALAFIDAVSRPIAMIP